ncbi:phospho-2-dehydro-3-deoxyheptonate aldolase, partial [Jimgerdemannia flammicorona]
TDGNINIAIDAIKAASVGHHFLSVTKQGLSAIVRTEGNETCHAILRGSTHGPNFDADNVRTIAQQLGKAKLVPRVMIDCSHGNSSKDHRKQVIAAECVVSGIFDSLLSWYLWGYGWRATQLGTRETGDYIMGVMIESHLKEGRQDIPLEGPQKLVYGQSVTDACISWESTVQVLDRLREGVKARRART